MAIATSMETPPAASRSGSKEALAWASMAERERASTTYWAPSGSRTASAALGWMRAADAM